MSDNTTISLPCLFAQTTPSQHVKQSARVCRSAAPPLHAVPPTRLHCTLIALDTGEEFCIGTGTAFLTAGSTLLTR